MSDLIDRQALRAAHGLGSDCHDCKRDMKSCQYDRDYSLMDFCEWLDDAPSASPWHRVEELPKKNGKYAVCWTYQKKIYWDWLIFLDGNWVLHAGLPLPDYWMSIEPPKEVTNE